MRNDGHEEYSNDDLIHFEFDEYSVETNECKQTEGDEGVLFEGDQKCDRVVDNKMLPRVKIESCAFNEDHQMTTGEHQSDDRIQSANDQEDELWVESSTGVKLKLVYDVEYRAPE